MRIGTLARETGTTVRTVRYYEEIGLLPSSEPRAAGAHREYGPEDVERLTLILRLRDLLGLSLDELRDVIHGEDARVARRREYRATSDPESRRRLLAEGRAHTDRLLALVRRRADELAEFEAELRERRTKQSRKLGELV
ncbi:MAG TPA: MerR family transcriptional regulator [Solirubrobacter sp.]|nr:MerR family transcriptional regulator [Solirubrobacter sp.]